MKRTRPQALILGIAAILIVSATIAVMQRARMGEMQTEVERLKQSHDPTQKKSARPGRERPFSVGKDGKPELSGQGVELLPDVRALIAKLASALSTYDRWENKSAAERESAERLRELMVGIGGETMQSLLADLSAAGMNPEALRTLRGMFGAMNPEQSLRWRLTEERDEDWEWRFGRDFQNWMAIDPAAALKWFYAAEAQGEQVTASKRVLRETSTAEGRTDPVKATERLNRLANEGEERMHNEGDSVISIHAPTNPGEQLALVNALNAMAEKPGVSREFLLSRDQTMREVFELLHEGTASDGIAVADGSFTPDQKRKFLEEFSCSADPGESEKWVEWIMRQDCESIGMHPLIKVSWSAAQSVTEYGDPQWLLKMEPSPLRDRVVYCYGFELAESQPTEAIRWLSTMPRGGDRRDLAREVGRTLDKTDPAAADRIRAAEGVEKDR